MEDQASLDFVLLRERGALGWLRLGGTLLQTRGFPIRLAAREAVPPVRQFLDGMAFLESRQPLEQRASIGFLQVQTLGDLVGGGRFASNLQITQDVIGAE